MAETLRKWVDSHSWTSNSQSGSFSSTPILMSSTVLVLIVSTVAVFLSSPISSLLLSLKLKFQGKSPVPPGSLGLPVIGEVFSFFPDVNSFIAKRKVKYGPIFKSNLLGQTVFLPAPACNRFLFANESKVVQMTWAANFKKLLGTGALGMKVGDAYKRSRKYVLPLLSPSALAQYTPRIEEKVRAHLAEVWQPPVRENEEQEQDEEFELAIYKAMDRVAFWIIADLILSLDAYNPYTEELRNLFKEWAAGLRSAPLYIPGTVYYRSMKARARILAILGELLAERRVELKEGKASPNQDFLSYYLTEPEDNGELVPEAGIKDTLLQFLSGGHDTTAHVMTLTLRYIARYPEVYDRLREEHKSIAERKAPGESLTKEDLAAMKYTWNVILETMRLYPPVRGGFRQTLTNIDYDGFTIPKGWKMFWTTAPHMDPEFFQDPATFNPSRFEDQNSKRGTQPYVYTSFGGGPRICPGNDFAKVEMLIFMHCVISNYKFRLVYPDEPIQYTVFPGQKSGTLMRVQKSKLH